MTQSNQDQAVRAWAKSIGLFYNATANLYYNNRISGITDQQMRFFYTICQKAERDARVDGKLEAARYFKNYMISNSPFIEQIIDPYIDNLAPQTPNQTEDS